MVPPLPFDLLNDGGSPRLAVAAWEPATQHHGIDLVMRVGALAGWKLLLSALQSWRGACRSALTQVESFRLFSGVLQSSRRHCSAYFSPGNDKGMAPVRKI